MRWTRTFQTPTRFERTEHTIYYKSTKNYSKSKLNDIRIPLSISKAACKCTGFVHCTSSQHVELIKLSLFEHPVERCWVKFETGQTFGSTFPLFRCHPCVAQQSRVHLHSSARHFEPTHAQCLACPKILSHDSTSAFVKYWECSTCSVIVEVIWTPRSTNTQHVESLNSG